MSSQKYLSDHAAPDEAQAALMHTRNKVIRADFAAPTLADRVIRRFWYHSSALRNSALARSRPEVVISEQIIENALLLREVDATVHKALDFGGFESTMPLALAALGIETTVVDQRRYPFHHDRVHVIQHDILKPLEMLQDDFDLVYSISTLEHVGTGSYGDNRAAGDAVAVRHLWAKVRPGGRFFFTVPSGHPSQQESYRVYSPDEVTALLPAPGSVRYFEKDGRAGAWSESSAEAIAHHRYENYDVDLAVEGVAVAVVRKPAV
jgi:SAM-dependent methyltransferase